MPNLLKDFRYRIEYLGLRLIVALVRAAPMDVSVAVSGKIWRLIAPYDRRHKRALDNLAIAFPHMTRARARSHRAGHVGKPRPRHGRDDADRSHSLPIRRASKSPTKGCIGATRTSSAPPSA